MDPMTILTLVGKAVSIGLTLWENRDLAEKAFQSAQNLINNHDNVTPEELADVEAGLDALLDEFNKPLPEV